MAAALAVAASLVCLLLFLLDAGLAQRGLSHNVATVLRLCLQLSIVVYAGAWVRRLCGESRWRPALLVLRSDGAQMAWRGVNCGVTLTPRWVSRHLLVLDADDGCRRWQWVLLSHQLPPDDFRRLRSLANCGGLQAARATPQSRRR